jgi:serine/threonine protein kinase
MGILRQALDRYNGRANVVLKFMKIQNVSNDPQEREKFEKALERFMREIQIAMTLDHPHILPSLGYGYMPYEGYKQLYLVTPYIPGGSLLPITTQKKQLMWSLEETMDVLLQIAEGLQYMHSHPNKIVHLDVKPGNILLRSTQRSRRIADILLCDFGIARWQFTSRDRTSTAHIVGTIDYMAPEQANGKLWWTADQFSLAIMACELLTGKRPVYNLTDPDRHDDLMRQHRPSLLNFKRVWYPDVDDVILRALTLDPLKRFPSVMEFAQALQQAVMRQLTQPTEVSSSPHAVFMPISLQRVAAYEESQETIQSAEVEQKEAAVVSSKPVQKAFSPLQAQQVLKREHLPGRPSTIVWSPDGESIVCTFYGSIPPLIFKRDIGAQSEPIRGAPIGQAACWSPDGSILVVSRQSKLGGQSELRFWKRASPAEWPFVLPFAVPAIQEFDWSRRGQLAVWVNDQVYTYSLPPHLSHQRNQSLPHSIVAQGVQRGSSNAPNSVLRWSPDGSTLAIGTSNGSLLCWRDDSATILPQWDAPTTTRRITSLAWTSDGSCLTVAFANRRIVMWSVYERSIIAEWESSMLPAVPRLLSISHQGQISVVCSNKAQLTFGTFGAKVPSSTHHGQWFAAWSPTRTEFATLAAGSVTTMDVWQS